MTHTVTLIPGDGIGPEVAAAAQRAIDATGVKIGWAVQNAGASVIDTEGSPMPVRVLESIRRNKVALKGPVTTPVGYGFRSVNVALRKTLNLYACLRPCKTYPGVPTRYDNVDIVVVRENTEDLYIGIEFEKETPAMDKLLALVAETSGEKLSRATGVSLKTISEAGTRRIVRFAFDYARQHGRKK